MSEVELTLAEAKELQKELFGFRNETGEVVLKGLLSQDLKAVTKFEMMQFGKQIQEKDTAVEELRKELIEKYGTERTADNGQTYKEVLRFKKDKEGNDTEEMSENFLAFVKEYEELLMSKTTFKVTKLKKSDLDFKTDEVYPFVFEYLVQVEEGTPLRKLD